eukprot:scaffold81899_cov37-Tisochrysis_lutea.AAC.3
MSETWVAVEVVSDSSQNSKQNRASDDVTIEGVRVRSSEIGCEHDDVRIPSQTPLQVRASLLL